MKTLRSLLWVLVGVLILAGGGYAATLPLLGGPGQTNPSNNPIDIPDVNAAVISANQNINPSTMAPTLNFRNWLDNGALDIDVRGASQINCGGTTGSGTGASLGAGYVADRWTCIVNVTSQAGKTQILTTTPPPGFNQYLQIIRNSGALTQPVTDYQELQTLDVVKLQSQTVVLSCFIQALAGLSADNANAAQLIVITGTGTDQGMNSLTASPAITPAFSGVATPLNQAITISTSWSRYVSTPFTVGATVTEAVVGVGFTPTATGAGSTDGLNFTGCQFEVAPPNCIPPTTPVTPTTAIGTCASLFEFRPVQVEALKAARYYQVLLEIAALQPPWSFSCPTTNTPQIGVPFITPMRAAPSVPTSGNSQVLTVGGLKVGPNAGSLTALTGINNPATSNTVYAGTIAGTNTCATSTPTGAVAFSSTTGIYPFSADF